MTLEEFNHSFGSTFFIKIGKWGHQMTAEDAAKMGYSLSNKTSSNSQSQQNTRSGITLGRQSRNNNNS